MFAKGLPRNLGDPDVSTSAVEGRGLRHRRSSEEEPATATPRCLAKRSSPWYRGVRKRNEAGWAAGSRSAPKVPTKPEKRSPRDPVEGREAPGHGTAEGQHERDIGPELSVNETSADSGNGEEDAGSGTDHAIPPHRSRFSARGVSTNPQGWSCRCRRENGERVREQSRGEPRGAAGAVQIGDVLGAAGATRSYPERRWDQDPPHRHPHV